MAARYYPDFVVEAVGYTAGTTDFQTTVSLLKKSGIRYIYSVADTYAYPGLITEAYRQGIAGVQDDVTYTWITWVGIGTTHLLNKEFLPGDPILESARNMIILDSTIRSIPGVGRYNEFLQARKKMAEYPADMAFLQSKVPLHPNQPGYDPTFSPQIVNSTGRFSGTAAVLYDATIALGLGACLAAQVYTGSSNTSNTFDGATHYQGFLNVSFVGASGLVELDPTTGSRDSNSNIYAMHNLIPVPVPDSLNWTYTEVKTHHYDAGEWIELEPIAFIDGTNTPHPDLPPPQVEKNTIGTALRSVGFAMGCLVLVTSLGCSLWTFFNSDKRIV